MAAEDERDDSGVHALHQGIRHTAQIAVVAPRFEVLLPGIPVLGTQAVADYLPIN